MRNVPKGLIHVRNLIESLAEILPFNEESIQDHAKKFNIELTLEESRLQKRKSHL